MISYCYASQSNRSYLWDCCDGVYGTFCTIPTVESYGAGVFVPVRTLIAVKLLKEEVI